MIITASHQDGKLLTIDNSKNNYHCYQFFNPCYPSAIAI